MNSRPWQADTVVVYCLDTSAILDGWVRFYPPDVFPTLWEKLEVAARHGTLISPEEVLRELEKKHDDVFTWAKAQSPLFIPLDDAIQDATSQVLEAFPGLVKAIGRRNQADPFVIALAIVRRATVVTAEVARGSQQRPRIPDVCDQLGIPCVNLIQMIRLLGWRFR